MTDSTLSIQNCCKPDPMLLDPDLLTLMAPLELKARMIIEGFISGLHRSPWHGFSVEFAEHRPYNPGDDFKHIDWKVYGKTDRFYVRRYEEETNLRAWVALDTSSSMYFRYHAGWSKLRYSIHLAAALIYMMNRQRDATGLVTFDREIRELHPPASSGGHLKHLFGRLESLLEEEKAARPEGRRSGTARILHDLAERAGQRSLVIVLSDLFENPDDQETLISALRHLRHRKHEVLLFNVLEFRSERELDFPAGQFRFQDLETGEEMELNPAWIRNSYREKMEQYRHRLKVACSDMKIDFHEIDTAAPLGRALLAWLKKRKRLG